tara:strand:+ start:17916 stop:18986 length:1071 start_codon:yes stop_codon:yes gene_type:complete
MLEFNDDDFITPEQVDFKSLAHDIFKSEMGEIANFDMANASDYQVEAEIEVDPETGEIVNIIATIPNKKPTLPATDFIGFHDIEMSIYRNADGLANSELQMFNKNPSNYVWAKNAPSDPTKVDASDFGTALHTSLLEPELYDDQVIIASTKGRTSAKFQELQKDNKGSIVLTDAEDDQIKLMTDSAIAHPMFQRILCAKGACEGSIFVDDPITGLRLKIRPDKIIDSCSPPIFNDVKSTRDIEDWRNSALWKNPLFDMGYGFTAAYYMYVGSIYYNIEMTTYNFCVVSKSASLGRYPVSVFTITKDQLIEYGFWQEMLDALAHFKECKEKNKWVAYEQFPEFRIFDDGEVTVTFEE